MKRAKDLTAALKEFKIDAVEDNGFFDADGESFLMGIDREAAVRDTLYYRHADKAKVWVAGDKKLKQAVLKVVEDERVVPISWEQVARRGDWETKEEHSRRATQYRKKTTQMTKSSWGVRELSRKGGVQFPFDTELEMRNYKVKRKASGRDIIYDYSMDVVVPKTKMCLLVGTDESEMFISQLPKMATTVNRAHVVLRPKGWKKEWPRQGEFFFRPLTTDELKKLYKKNRFGSRPSVYANEAYMTK